ncbi:MAG TPA: hypothetical protein ENO25_05870 [Desulfobacteraceae bacterium]|nr:hypothetical protein [Desulfobacteraceae bacterium]
MNDEIIFDVIGNTSPFSMMGESSGYMVTVNDCSYLLECGSPIFPTLGYQGIAEIKGIFATHSHEDHKRWFTDMVLFSFYNPLLKNKVRLVSSEPVLEEFAKNSKGALERSLSHDSKRIVDIPYDNMVEEVPVGPRSKYSIRLKTSGGGRFRYQVEDRKGNIIGPEKAKIFINPAANRPRLLYRDDETGEWVEPESYYPFSSPIFYEKDQNVFHDEEAGLTVKALKSSVWHGVPTVAFKFMTESNTLLFSADTVYKPSLWKELYAERRPQKFGAVARDEFKKGSIIYGDINDFIERTWSRERYEAAMRAYDGSIVIHDVARKNSVVHTDYADIGEAPIEKLLFTHNPDNLTARRPILTSGKRIVLRSGDVFEWVRGELFPFDADVYIHHFSSDLVGYESQNGAYKIIEKDGLLGVVDVGAPGHGILRVDLLQDIGGEYFPLLDDPSRCYFVRGDGRVEEVTFDGNTSQGRVIDSVRGKMKSRGSPGGR